MNQKSSIPLSEAQRVIDRVIQELGLLTSKTGSFQKIQASNRHRVYVNQSKTLGIIACTMPVPEGEEGSDTYAPPAKNGSIVYHVTPTLEALEKHLRRLVDPALENQVINRPRPFQVSKQRNPVGRKPLAVVAPIPPAALEPVPDGGSLKERLLMLKERGREVRIARLLENDETTEMTRNDAARIVDGESTLEEFMETFQNANANSVSEALSEAGIDIGEAG